MRGRVNQYNKLHCIILRNSHSHPNLQQPDQLAATNIEARPSTGQNIKICWGLRFSSVQFRSVTQLCPTLCNSMDCSTPGLPVHHQLPESTQTNVHWVGDAIQPSHPLLSPSPALNLSQHQGLSNWVSSLHQVAKVLEFQLQHQSFQWLFRTDFL